MVYTPVAQQLCSWDVLQRAPPDHYLALNIAYIKSGPENVTCRVSLGTIPHKVIDPDATTNYRMFSSLLTPAGMSCESREEVCQLECSALEAGCQELNRAYVAAGMKQRITADNFFLLLNGRVVHIPEKPLKF